VEVARIVVPRSIAEVAAAVTSWPGQVAVGGGRYSMGGQVAVRGGLHLDMRRMNGLVWLHPAERVVRVQASMRWRDLQDLLDPLGLAVKIMRCAFQAIGAGRPNGVAAQRRPVAT
jgi:FAD/FMN-containing dehydrogenase